MNRLTRQWNRHRTGLRELILFSAIYVLYCAARWLFAGSTASAHSHAHAIIHLEAQLHIGVEHSVQHALGGDVAGFFLSNIYLIAQLAVLPGSLIWLYWYAPSVYRQLRTTVVFAWLISIPVFALYPVAPPRLAEAGISDTVSRQAVFALTGRSTLFYNPDAAVPSLHVGLAFAIGIAVAAALHTKWAKPVALCWGPLVTLAVVVTGNHYVFDAVTGVLLTTISYVLTRITAHVRLKVLRDRIDATEDLTPSGPSPHAKPRAQSLS